MRYRRAPSARRAHAWLRIPWLGERSCPTARLRSFNQRVAASKATFNASRGRVYGGIEWNGVIFVTSPARPGIPQKQGPFATLARKLITAASTSRSLVPILYPDIAGDGPRPPGVRLSPALPDWRGPRFDKGEERWPICQRRCRQSWFRARDKRAKCPKISNI